MNTIMLRTALALCFTFCAAGVHASVKISSDPTKNMSCVAGVCSPTAKDAVLNVDDLTTMLASADVTVKSGAQAVTIGVFSPLAWASTHRLTLDAALNVNIKAPVTVEGTAAGLTILTNDGGSGGDLIFSGKGNVAFWDLSSSLTVNANSYTLVGDIKTLAADIAANPAGFYALANDYDASVDGRYTHPPVMTELTGTFEGLGHTISNLYVQSQDYGDSAALFDRASGTLRDLGLRKVYMFGYSAAGLLVVDDAATIAGCHATGTVFGYGYGGAGGLVAESSSDDFGGTIVRSHAAVNASASDYGTTGGLVGVSYGLNISQSSASGRVFGGLSGGLVGAMYSGSISQSFSTGGVKSRGDAGGLVGLASDGSIQDSYATDRVNGGGGLDHGGFAAGFEDTIVHSSYSIGAIKPGGKHVTQGGFVGLAGGYDDLKSDYWDLDTSGMTQGIGSCKDDNCDAIEGLTTNEFLSALPRGFNRKIWAQSPSINNGYPYLIANPPPK